MHLKELWTNQSNIDNSLFFLSSSNNRVKVVTYVVLRKRKWHIEIDSEVEVDMQNRAIEINFGEQAKQARHSQVCSIEICDIS